jgi:hypothetical protein
LRKPGGHDRLEARWRWRKAGGHAVEMPITTLQNGSESRSVECWEDMTMLSRWSGVAARDRECPYDWTPSAQLCFHVLFFLLDLKSI